MFFVYSARKVHVALFCFNEIVCFLLTFYSIYVLSILTQVQAVLCEYEMVTLGDDDDWVFLRKDGAWIDDLFWALGKVINRALAAIMKRALVASERGLYWYYKQLLDCYLVVPFCCINSYRIVQTNINTTGSIHGRYPIAPIFR